MAIIGSVFALLGRFAGKLVNSVLSWATVLLFGAVEPTRQTVLALVALGSAVWVALVVGVVLPDVGSFLIAAIPVPDFISETVVRLAMLVAAIVLPLVSGATIVWMLPADQRLRGGRLAVAILRGYPFTVALALTIAVLAVVAISRKVSSLAKGTETAHVPVVIKPGQYDPVLAELGRVSQDAGLDVAPKAASRFLSIPPKILERAAGGLGGLVPDRLMLLEGPELSVLIYPSDVAITGSRSAVARARAAFASGLARAPAYLTTSPDAQRVEDAIDELAESPPADGALLAGALRRVDDDLSKLTVPFDEWETLYRQRLQVERDLIRADATPSVIGASPEPSPRPATPLVWTAAVLVLGLLVIDVVLTARERAHPRGRRGAR